MQCFFFFYVKKRLPCVKKNRIPYVKMRTCTWKNLQKCPWKTNCLRENFLKFTYVKIGRSIREKNEKFLTWKLWTLTWKKYEKKIVVFFNKEILSLLWAYNSVTSTLRVTPTLLRNHLTFPFKVTICMGKFGRWFSGENHKRRKVLQSHL